MKTINGIFSTLLVLVLVTGCMPDSLTKFKENPVKDAPVTSGGTDEPDPCSVGNDPICTPPIDFAYPVTEAQYTIGKSITTDLVPELIGGLEGVEDYLTYSITPIPSTNPTLKNATGLNFSTTTGEITGTVTKYSPSTSQYLVTLKHTSPEDGTITTVGTPITLSITTGTELTKVALNMSVTCAAISGSCLAVGQTLNDLKYYDLTVGTVSPFTVGQKIVSNTGVQSEVVSIDTTNKILRVKLTDSTLDYNTGDNLDNVQTASGPIYVTGKTGIVDSVLTIVNSATYPDINYTITPQLTTKSTIDTSNGENAALLYIVSPSFTEQYAYDLDGDNSYDAGEVIPSPASLTGQLIVRTPTVGDTLTAREFSYSVYHSSLKTSVTKTVKIKVEGTTGLAANGRVFYPTNDGDRIIIDLASATNFAAGGSLTANSSAAADPVANVDFVHANRIYATSNCGGICEDSFAQGMSVDNAATFVASETTITSAYIIRDKDSSFTDITPAFDTDLAQLNDEKDITFSMTPDIATLDPKLVFQTKSACSNTTYLTRSTCIGAAETWYPGGSIRASTNTPPFNLIAPQDFAISAETIDGRTINTTLKFGVGPIPTGVSTTQLALVKVSNTTNFKEGDVITSSEDGTTRKGKGFVRRVFTSEKYIVVEIEDGTFSDGDSLNNKLFAGGTTFGGELAYVQTNGVTHFSSLLILTDTAQNYAQGDVITQGAASGYVVLDFDSGGSEYVLLSNSSGSFATGSNITNGTVTKTVNNILSVNLAVTASTVPGADFVIGGESAITDSTGATNLASAYINSINGSDLNVTTRKGMISFGNRVYSINPMDALRVAPSFVSVSQVAEDHSFYIYRGVNSTLNISSLFGGSLGNQKYIISPALPNGLSIPEEGVGIISGSALSASEKKAYTVTLLNDFGYESHSFNLEVQDYFEVNAVTNNTTYATHKWGYGNSRASCRVTKAQIDNATSTKDTDIVCFVDGNEGEIRTNGLKVEVNAGPDICANVVHTPFFYENFPIIDTGVTIVRHTGDTEDGTCATEYNNRVVGAGGVNPGEVSVPTYTKTVTDQFEKLAITGPDKMCYGNYSQLIDGALPNCDIGAVRVQDIAVKAYCNGGTGTDADSCPTSGGVWSCSFTNDVETISECGGEISKCVEGGIDNVLTASEINNGLTNQYNVFSTGETVSKVYDYSIKTSEKVIESNVRIANYSNKFCPVANAYENDFKKAAKYKSDIFSRGSSAYVYTCLDSANAPIARVHLYVRDWNTKFTMANDIESFVPATLMDDAGLDGFGEEINSNYDLDDFFFGTDTAMDCSTATPTFSGAAIAGGGILVNHTKDQRRITISNAASFDDIDGLGTPVTLGQTIAFGGNNYVVVSIINSTTVDLHIPVETDGTNVNVSFPQGYIYPLVGIDRD